MKLKILISIILTFIIKIYALNWFIKIKHYNLFNGGRDLFYFLTELIFVLVIASLIYILLGNIKDKSVSFKRGFIASLLICAIIFIGFSLASSTFGNSRPHKYFITIIKGDAETVQRFKALEEAYPNKIINVESLNDLEQINPFMTNEREINESPFINIYVYTSVKTGFVGLDTYNVEKAISYLEKNLE